MADNSISIEIAPNTFTTKTGLVTTDQRLVRGGLTQIGVSFTGKPVYTGLFSGGMATIDEDGHLTFPNPPPAVPTKANYILYNADGRIKMNPKFNVIKPDGEDGPSFLFLAEPY